MTPIFDTPTEYLLDCVRSVESVYFSRLGHLLEQWIVVIDGDPRDLESVLTTSSLCPGRMRVIRLGENVGLGAAKNVGARSCTGGYVTWLDADDVLVPAGFAAFVRLSLRTLVTSPECFMTISDNYHCDPGLAVRYQRRKGPFVAEHIAQRSTRHDPIYSVDFVFPSMLVRREDFLHVGGFREGRIGEDVELVLRMATEFPTRTIRHIPAVAYAYRDNPFGIVRTRTAELRAQNAEDYHAARIRALGETRRTTLRHAVRRDAPDLRLTWIDAVPVAGEHFNVFLPAGRGDPRESP